MFKNRMQWRIFGPKIDEETGGRRRLHNKQLRNFYTSRGVITMVKEAEMGRACRTNGDRRKHMGYWLGKEEKKIYAEHQDVSWWIILTWI
jgi:hypothetical protein